MKRKLVALLFVWAILLSLAIPAFAEPVQEESETVKVLVENVQGGALLVTMNLPEGEYVLPIGEEVAVPKSSVLFVEPSALFYEKSLLEDVEGYCKEIIIKSGEQETYIDRATAEWGYGFEVLEDTVITAKFEADLIKYEEDEGYLNMESPNHLSASGMILNEPGILSDLPLSVQYVVGEERTDVNFSNMQIEITRVRYLNLRNEIDTNTFRISQDGKLSSNSKLDYGRYWIDFFMRYKGEEHYARLLVSVGKRFSFGTIVGEYTGGWQGDTDTFGLFYSIKNTETDDYYLNPEKLTIADVLKMEEDIEGKLWGYTFVDFVDKTGKVVSQDMKLSEIYGTSVIRRFKKNGVLHTPAIIEHVEPSHTTVVKEPTVTVKIENVPGGLLWVTMEENGKEYVLPIDEEIEIPKDSVLSVYPKAFNYWNVNDRKVSTRCQELSIVVGEDEKIINNSSCYTFIASDNTNISAEFIGLIQDEMIEHGEYLIQNITSENMLTGPSKLKNKKIELSYWDGEKYEKIDFSDLNFTIQDVKFEEEGKKAVDISKNLFEVTADGMLNSTDVLKLGTYRIYYSASYNGIASRPNDSININVGKTILLETVLGKYDYYESEERKQEEKFSTGELINYGANKSQIDCTAMTLGDIISWKESEFYTYSDGSIYGYKQSGYTDRSGNVLNDSALIGTLEKTHVQIHIVNQFSKDGIEYVPVTVEYPERVMEGEEPGWHKVNSKWYLYDENRKKVTNAWVEKEGLNVWVNADGAMVTNGIAGPEGEKVYVNKTGAFDKTKNGTVVQDGKDYIVENGIVISESIHLNVPTNMEAIEEMLDYLENSEDWPEEKQKQAADMTIEGLGKLSKEEKKGMTAEEIERIERVLGEIYEKNLTDGEKIVEDKLVPSKNSELAIQDIESKGGIAASSIRSEDIEAGKRVRVEVVQKATQSNAEHVRFGAKMYVDDKEVKEWNSPVVLQLTMPETFVASYSNASKYTAVHEKDGKAEEFNPDLKEDGSIWTLILDSFGQFVLKDSKLTNVEPEPDPTPKPDPEPRPDPMPQPGKDDNKPSSSSSRRTSRGKSATGAVVIGAGNWKMNENGWQYQFTDGTYPAGKWQYLYWNGEWHWYYFDETGYMQTGWMTRNGVTYYLHPTADGMRGYMYTGWKEIDGKWYYFIETPGKEQGALLKNAITPDGYQVDENGVWIK